MFFFRRQIKKLSATLALLLFLAGALLATHHHSTLKNEKESNCSICQISHSNTKHLSNGSSFEFADFTPPFHLFFFETSFISSKNSLTSPIRGPPSFI